eukprot:jgi/Tetstr1/453290/TSEL_040282.t1
MDRSLAPSSIAGRLAAISDWHRRQLPHLRLAGRPAVIPCKNEGVSALTSVPERRITRPAKGRLLPIRIPDLRAMLRRGFSLSTASGRHQRHHLPEPGVRDASAVPLPPRAHLRLPRVRLWRRALLRAQAVLFDAELGCRCIRLRVDVDKNVDARHECLAYIPDHVPCLAIRPVDMLEDRLRVFRPAPGGRRPAASKSSRVGPQNFHITPYPGFNSAFKAAYERAPSLTPPPGRLSWTVRQCRQSLRTQFPRAVALMEPPLQEFSTSPRPRRALCVPPGRTGRLIQNL